VSIRVLIVDDEPLARQRLRSLLEAQPDLRLLGECASGPEAVEAVREQRPDLIFLDVQMPGMDGFGVLKAIQDEPMPAVVFVTAYDRYAIQAFEVHALDYLLKPFDQERFQKALQRARGHLAGGKEGESDVRVRAALSELEGQPGGAAKPLDRIVIKSSGKVFFLRVEEIDWIEAAGNYLRLHVGREAHLLRETLSKLEAQLDPSKFLRIHRSTMVNVESIRELQPAFHGDYVVILRDGTELPLSRTYRQKLQELFGTSF
jgi:two-component system LytT family response regulator